MGKPSNLFSRKPLGLLLDEMKGGGPPPPRPRAVRPDRPGRRRDHRHRHLRPGRRGRPSQGRARADALVRRRRHRLHLRRALLRRVRRDGPRRRLGLHLCLRDPRRTLRLDHRLGPHPGIRRRRGDGLARLVEILPGLPGYLRRPPAEGLDQGPLRLQGDGRGRDEIDLDGDVYRPARAADRGPHHGDPGAGDQGKRPLQRDDGGGEAGDRPVRHRRRRLLRQAGETGTPSPPSDTAGSASSATGSRRGPSAPPRASSRARP